MKEITAAKRVLAQAALQELPNILLYGSHGQSMVGVIEAAMCERFGTVQRRECVNADKLVYYETSYFFEIDLANPNQPKDMACFAEFVKSIIVHQAIHTQRHILIVYNIERAHDRQAFRVLLERFSNSAWFVCTTMRLAALEMPLRSRFMMIRVPCVPCEREHEHNSLFRHTPWLVEFVKQRQPHDIDSIRAMSFRTFQQGLSLRDVAWNVIDALQGKRARGRLTDFIAAAAALEHRLKCTNGGREPLYHELLLHCACNKCKI